MARYLSAEISAARVYDAHRSDHFLDLYAHPESIQPAVYGELVIGETGRTWTRLPALHADGNLRLGF